MDARPLFSSPFRLVFGERAGVRVLLFFALLLANAATASAQTRPSPPPQPTKGPGSSDYPYASLIPHRYGTNESEYWIIEPANPTPKSAPVIIFCHGWGAFSPNPYGAWITHLVRRGNIVIFPRYQAILFAPMKDFTPNSIVAIKAAFAELQNPDHVRPELDHVAIVGHSMGGAIAPNITALAKAENLPIPKALCCVEPANHPNWAIGIQMPAADLSKIPTDTLVQVIVGDRDRIASDDTAKFIYSRLGQIPSGNKDYITLVSDEHGYPPLIANHRVPIASIVLDGDAAQYEPSARHRPRQTLNGDGSDALNYYGIWKLFDALTDAGFYGQNRDYALGNTRHQRFMGLWSDGTPVRELKILAPN
jgi:acetyl esterase/lipase